MSSGFAQRFQVLVDQFAKGNKALFAQLSGKSASHIYKICRGSSRPSMVYLQHLYDELQIDLNWLLTGEGQTPLNQQQGNSDFIYAPMLDVQASAGLGSEGFSEEIDDYFAFNKQWLSRSLGVSSEQLVFVRINGDSMLPTLQHDDQVLVDMSVQSVNKDAIYLLQTESGLMAKRLKPAKNHAIDVISDNPAYDSWQINAQNHQQHQVKGKVVWCARSI